MPKKAMITIDKIEEMYSNMKANGVNTDTTMLYGYFFISDKSEKFDKAANELKQKGFHFVEIYQTESKSEWWLHVERKEIHNAKSLFKLNKELYEIADNFKIEYDGYDVGNIDPNKPIDRNTYVVPEEFKATDFDKNNFPCLLVGNTAFDRFPHKDEFYYFLKVILKYEHDEKVMLPTEEELDKLDEFENFIENKLTQNTIENYYVFRDTYKGFRNFYIVTKDSLRTIEVMKLIKISGKQRQFDYEIIADKNWNLYNEIRPKFPKE
jgi:hypothetical protein